MQWKNTVTEKSHKHCRAKKMQTPLKKYKQKMQIPKNLQNLKTYARDECYIFTQKCSSPPGLQGSRGMDQSYGTRTSLNIHELYTKDTCSKNLCIICVSLARLFWIFSVYNFFLHWFLGLTCIKIISDQIISKQNIKGIQLQAKAFTPRHVFEVKQQLLHFPKLVKQPFVAWAQEAAQGVSVITGLEV